MSDDPLFSLLPPFVAAAVERVPLAESYGAELRQAALSLAAAVTGRFLLLTRIDREAEGLTWRRFWRTVLWEIPLIAAFATVGWALSGWLQASDHLRVVIGAVLSHYGKEVMDRLADAGVRKALDLIDRLGGK